MKLTDNEKREVELIWNGKTSDVTNIVLPFRVIEQIDEPRIAAGGKKSDTIQQIFARYNLVF